MTSRPSIHIAIYKWLGLSRIPNWPWFNHNLISTNQFKQGEYDDDKPFNLCAREKIKCSL